MRSGKQAARNGAGAHPTPGRGWSDEPAAARWQVRIVVPGLPLQATSVLLSRGAEHILVDTGFPAHEAILIEGLQRAGVAADAVTAVINTHYHLDHFGANDHFPQAVVYGSKLDFEWATSIYDSVCSGESRREVFRTFYPEVTDDEFDNMDNARLLQLIRWMYEPAICGDLGRYRWFEEHEFQVPGLHIVQTPGHTPGHVSVAVDGVEGPYLILGDARSFFDNSTLGYDMPPHNHAVYQQTRTRILDRFAGILIPGHDDAFTQAGDPADLGRHHGRRTTLAVEAPGQD